MDLVAKFEEKQRQELEEQKKTKIPAMRIGDTIKVSYRIQEGEKFRNQPFQGTLIKMRGSGITFTITLRKIVAREGVERTFPLYSPNLVSIKTVRYGKARRAKLYYLRDRVGKATKIKERKVFVTEEEKKPKKKKVKKTQEEKEMANKAKVEKKKGRKAKKKSTKGKETPKKKEKE